MEEESGRVFDSRIEYYKRDWHEYYSAIVRLIPPNVYVLDIGCGRGGLLKYLRDKLNCRVKGCDISDEAIKICKEKGIDAFKCDVEKEKIQGKYDVIVLSAVLEHLIDPVSVLKRLKNNLKKEGSIVVGVPNFSYILARIQYLLGRNVKRFDSSQESLRLGIQPYGHLHFFNKATLSYLLKRTGYDPIEWSYYTGRGVFGLHINHALFAPFIAVRAKKIE